MEVDGRGEKGEKETKEEERGMEEKWSRKGGMGKKREMEGEKERLNLNSSKPFVLQVKQE